MPTDPLFLISQKFRKQHEQVLTSYLRDDRKLTTGQWQLLFEAINYLDHSMIEINGGRFTFRQLFDRYVDQAFADEFLEQLTGLANIANQIPMLTATFARKIMPTLEQQRLLVRDNPQSYLFFAYCVYWWQSFARGYSFEMEIRRDLETSHIAFEMHDVRNRAERYSQADLIVLDLLGDIKTSIYFLQESAENWLKNDFYITQLHEHGKVKTFVVFQKPFAWHRIGGRAAIPGTMDDVLSLLPLAVKLDLADNDLIVVDFITWKNLVQETQKKQGSSNA